MAWTLVKANGQGAGGLVPARLAKQTGAGDQRRLGVIPYRVPAQPFEDAGIGEKYNISVSWRAALWREGKRRGSQHPKEVGTADPRVDDDGTLCHFHFCCHSRIGSLHANAARKKVPR